MNIGIITTWFERGASYVSRQYMKLLQKQHCVFIYARGGESYAKENPEWNLPNVTWARNSFRPDSTGTAINKSDFIHWIRKNNIEVAFFNEQQWWPPILWSKEIGLRVGTYIDYYTEETIPFFEIFDFIICNTKRHHSVFDWHKECHYLPWGTDVDLFKPKEKRVQDKDKIVFFNSSGFNPDRKGVYPLLIAFNNLKDDRKKLILHSQVDLVDYFRDISHIINKLKDKNQLEIINETIGAPGLYYLGDVYCYLSKLDGLGLTLPEAISCGLQAIVPDNAPMNEFVVEGINGKLVNIQKYFCRRDAYYWPCCEISIDDLTDKMRYFSDRFEHIAEYKEKSRNYALENLDWNSREGSLLNIFSSELREELNPAVKKNILKFELSRLSLKVLFTLCKRIIRSSHK